MNAYRSYFDRQRAPEALHRRLLELEAPAEKHKGGRGMKIGALAACMALLIGVGGWFQGRGELPPPAYPTEEADRQPQPTQEANEHMEDSAERGDRAAFVAQGPGEESKLMFPAIHWVQYEDVTGNPQMAASLALPEGSFSAPLSKEEITRIFWGAEGKPEVTNPKTDTGDFPLFLMQWQDYLISGDATYDGSGELWMLWVRGEKGEDSFTLRLCPGRLPPECVVMTDRRPTVVLDTEVMGWSQSYDCDGDGTVEHIVGSRFMAGDYGVEFENVGSGGSYVEDGETDRELAGACEFNAMLVNQLVRADGAPYLDHLLHADKIPDWYEAGFESLEAARACEGFSTGHPEADFARYLPAKGPEGYGEFNGRLSYQEEVRKTLWVRWSKVGGYDDVEVQVWLPEGDSTDQFSLKLVDVDVPESYDWRLYDIPICGNVPEEYELNFYKPAFRASELSLEVVQARMSSHDTGGESCQFYVVHDSGVVVGYSCSGVSAEYIWSLIEPTLN